MTIRDGTLDHNKSNAGNLRVRIGINLGSIRVVKDINDRPNIIGDGINVAQRIMSFAGENQILVSRSYFEVTSRLTNEITDMFTYSGVKQDKHVREHEVYSIKVKRESEPMPEVPFSAPADKAEEAVKLGDILKPSSLIIALIASVLLILLGWYVFILKPAFSESNPIDLRVTEPIKQPLSNASDIDRKTVAPEPAPERENAIITAPLTDSSAPIISNAPVKKLQATPVKKKITDSETEKRSSEQKPAAATKSSSAKERATNTQKSQPSRLESLKALFPPASKPTCTQAQIAMNQCKEN